MPVKAIPSLFAAYFKPPTSDGGKRETLPGPTRINTSGMRDGSFVLLHMPVIGHSFGRYSLLYFVFQGYILLDFQWPTCQWILEFAGYCQGMNYIAGVLLLVLGDVSDAYRAFVVFMNGFHLAGELVTILPSFTMTSMCASTVNVIKCRML